MTHILWLIEGHRQGKRVRNENVERQFLTSKELMMSNVTIFRWKRWGVHILHQIKGTFQKNAWELSSTAYWSAMPTKSQIWRYSWTDQTNTITILPMDYVMLLLLSRLRLSYHNEQVEGLWQRLNWSVGFSCQTRCYQYEVQMLNTSGCFEFPTKFKIKKTLIEYPEREYYYESSKKHMAINCNRWWPEV